MTITDPQTNSQTSTLFVYKYETEISSKPLKPTSYMAFLLENELKLLSKKGA